jgi:hypothetical protein
MSRSPAEKNAVLIRLLYDMCVLAAGLKFLREWHRRPKELDIREEQLALTATLMKERLLYDFFYKSNKRTHPDDVTADQILAVNLLDCSSDETAFRESINKWCAHMSWQRVVAKKRPPTPKQAKQFGDALLSHARSFVAGCLNNGFKLNKTGRIYWKRFNTLYR